MGARCSAASAAVNDAAGMASPRAFRLFSLGVVAVHARRHRVGRVRAGDWAGRRLRSPLAHLQRAGGAARRADADADRVQPPGVERAVAAAGGRAGRLGVSRAPEGAPRADERGCWPSG